MAASMFRSLFADLNSAETAYAPGEPVVTDIQLPDKTDTAVIGGGLLGLSTALELAGAGQAVVVVEANRLGAGPSGRSGGQLWPGFEGGLAEFVSTHGENQASKIWNLIDEALGWIHLRAASRPDKCEFSPGVLLASKTQPQAKWIDTEFKASRNLGLVFANHVSADEIRNRYVNTDLYLNGIVYEGTEPDRQYGHINPHMYLYVVARLAQNHGVAVLDQCAATRLDRLRDGRYRVTTPKGDVNADNVVVAGGADFRRPDGIGFGMVARGFVPVTTAIVATEPMSEQQARELLPGDACFCDASDAAMHYGRMIPARDRPGYYRLTLGGADALSQLQAALEIPRIESEMRAMFPQLDRQGIKVETVWAGNCDLSRNAIPYIANPQKGIFHAGGFSGQGMVCTSLYGRAIADRILGNASERFSLLEQISPPPYARCGLLAHLQALTALAPVAFETYLENRAERHRRVRDIVDVGTGH
jgi:gamma-glutamylputrescine oxidase